MSKILDIQQSIAAANGNVSLAKELFTMLLDDLNMRLQQIESSFEQNNMDELAEHIHKLYGATAYCIVPSLRKYTALLDTSLKQKDYSQLGQSVNDVIKEIKTIINNGPEFIQEDWLNFQ